MPNASKYIIDVANIRPGGNPIKGLYVGSSEKKYATLGNKCIYDKVFYELSVDNITNVEPNAQTVTISSYTSKRTHGNGAVDTLYINPSTKQITANTSTANTKDTTVVVNQALTLNGTTTGTGVTVTITQIKDYPTGLTLTISPKSTIPAAGGSISSALTNYTYNVKANYKSGNNNVDVTSDSNTTITANVTGVTAASKGTIESNVTTAGTIRFTASYTCNGKTVAATTDVNITQDKNEVVSYANPTFTLTPSSNQTLPASGGKVTASVSNVQQVRTWSSNSTDTFSPSYTSTWNAQTISCNSRGTVTGDTSTLGTTTATVTANGKSTTKSYVVYQQENKVTDYSKPTGLNLSCADIPAGGGTVAAVTGGTISQTRTYTSKATDTINPTVTITWNPSQTATANSLGTTDKARTKITTLTATYTANSQSNTSSVDVYQAKNGVINTNYSPSNYEASVSIGNGITAGGGSATVTASARHLAYDLYDSGSYNNQHYVADGVTVTEVSDNNNRYSYSNGTLTHSSMTTNLTTDSCTLRATNNTSTSTTKDASVSVTNTRRHEGDTPSNYVATISIGNGMVAKGGSATVTTSAYHTNTFTWAYTSGSKVTGQAETITDTADVTIDSNGNNRFSYSNGTVSHSNMTTNVTTDTVTLRVRNHSNTGTTNKASKSIQNKVENSDYNASNSNYTANISIGSGLSAAGGSATVTASGSHTHTYYYYYTSESTSGPYTRTDSDGASWAITENGNSRFSENGNALNHSSMTTNVTTDYVTVKATNKNNSSATASTRTSVSNAVTNSDYNASNTNYTASISIGDGLTAAGGSATVTASAGHTHKYYYLYTSQSTSGPYYSYPSDDVSTSMIGNGNSRFSYSNGTISHSSMGTDVTTDTVTIRATNNANGSTADASKSISNAVISTTWGDITGTPTGSCSDIPAGGGTVTATATTPQTLAQNYKYNYTSGSQDANWKSTNVSCYVSYPNGNTATASSLGTTVKDRAHVATLTVRASANGKTKDGYVYVYQKANAVTSTEWGDLSLTDVTLSCADVPARGGTVTPSRSGTAKQNRRYQYTSGSYTAWELVNITPTVSWSPTSKTGNNLGQTDKVRTSLGDCTATFTGNSSKTATKAITVYQEANTHTDSWNSPVVTITYATFSAAGATKTPTTCSATQSGTRTWTSGSQTGITNTDFTWGDYSMTNGTGFTLANASTGAVTAESRGATTGASRSNSTIRRIATGAGSKQGTGSGTVTQEANAVTDSDYNASNTNFWAGCSIGDGLTAAGGSATVTANAGHTHEYYYLYTSNSTSGPYYSYPSDDVSTSMVTNGNNRFSYSNGIISHSSMGTDVTTDTVTIAAANYVSKSGSTASKEIVNKIESTIWGDITVTVPSDENVTSGSGSYVLHSGNTKAMQIYTYAYTSESRSTFTKNYYPSYKGITWSVASNHTGFTTGTTVISDNNVVPKIVIGDNKIMVPKISWDANNSTSSRSATITVSCTANDKTGSNSFTITQAAGVRYQFTVKNDSPYGVYGEFGSITPTGQSVSGDFPTGTNRTVDMVSDTVIINNYLGTVQGKTSGFVKFLCTGGGGSGSISGSIQSNGMVDATGTITIKNGSSIALDVRY